MKTVRAILIGMLIWTIGVTMYSLSFYVPILENAELQANIFLVAVVIPLVWLGSRLYYKKGYRTRGFLVGLVFFLTSGLLDALITVPMLIIPSGGSYQSFYTDPGFWLIGLEFILVAISFRYIKIHRRTELSNN